MNIIYLILEQRVVSVCGKALEHMQELIWELLFSYVLDVIVLED